MKAADDSFPEAGLQVLQGIPHEGTIEVGDAEVAALFEELVGLEFVANARGSAEVLQAVKDVGGVDGVAEVAEVLDGGVVGATEVEQLEIAEFADSVQILVQTAGAA